MRVRIIVRLKNDNFYQARVQAGYMSMASLSRASGINQMTLGRFESFQCVPVRQDIIEKIEKTLHVPFEYLFSEEVMAATGKIPKMFEFVKESPLLPENAVLLLPENAPMTGEEKEDRNLRLEKVVRELSPREQLVLTKRFGLFGEPALTLEKIGEICHLTRERIRSIEYKAIRRLRFPSRIKKIIGEMDFTEKKEDDEILNGKQETEI
jgi:RNA polymerase sigma factor (sigma-70 family)